MLKSITLETGIPAHYNYLNLKGFLKIFSSDIQQILQMSFITITNAS